MSQKAEALEAYKNLSDGYDSFTSERQGWRTLRTVKVTLLKEDDEMPDNISHMLAFIDAKVEQLVTLVQNELPLDATQPVFVRACPLHPRPGVLESCAAHSLEEVREVATRIITTMMSPDPSDKPMYSSALIDPHGTVIVQPFIDADASAVVSPNNYIIMGRDNDGVTAGKDGIKVTIPIQHCHDTVRDLTRLGMNPDDIEIEFVSQLLNTDDPRKSVRSKYTPSQRHAMVQLRGCDGPRPIGTPPKGVTISGTFHGAERITIKHTHLVSDNTDEQLDLMEQALREGMPEGSVVLHPNGSHLSHHAGQCLKYGVPYIASDSPQVGEQWTQAALGWVVLDNEGTFEPQPYDPLDYTDEFIKGFNIGFSNFARQHGWLSNHFHQFMGGSINNPAECAMYAGGFVAWLINATMSVGLGELRHIPTNTMNATSLSLATVTALYGKDNWVEVSGSKESLTDSRQSYYMMIENTPITLKSAISTLEFIMASYKLEWGSGYGGEKYHDSCKNAYELADAMLSFIHTPNRINFKAVIGKANLTEHNVHNNDFFFSKFISKNALNWGTDPSLVTIQPLLFFSVYYAARDIMDSEVRDMIDNTHIITLAKSITKADMRQTPLAKMDNEIGNAMTYLKPSQRHPNGKFCKPQTPLFIPCGVEDCFLCNEHTQVTQQQVSQSVLPIETSVEAPFPTKVKSDSHSSTMAIMKHISNSLNNGEDVLTDEIIITFAHSFNKGEVPSELHKYIANIIGHMNTEQLKTFSSATKEE